MNKRLTPSSEGTRARLSAQAVRDTRPELTLRRELHRQGLRYRVCYPVPGAPRRSIDIAFPGKRVAVFVDGCFWHACPVHSVQSKSNSAFWDGKLQRNVERDMETSAILHDRGWTVVRVWEHDLREVPSHSVQRVLTALKVACSERATVDPGM